MSNSWFISSYIFLWIFVVLVMVVLLALVRQVGVLHARLGPRGALQLDDVPSVGSSIPALDFAALNNDRIAVPAADSRTVMVVLNIDCSVCEELVPGIATLMREGVVGADIAVVVAEHDVSRVHEFAAKHRLSERAVAAVPDIGEMLGITSTPLALVVGADGEVRSAGVVNSREELEVLIARADVVIEDEGRNDVFAGDALPVLADGDGKAA